MPALTTEPPTAAEPLFVGLHSYTEAQADIFFGRDDEIDRLTNLIKANTLTIVFGKSGTGKTSLLNAGVFPRLRKEYCLPFRIRLEFADDSPDLVAQIKHTLKDEIDKYGFRVEAYPGAETLWEYFHREQLWKSVTPILIFDQFEEIFTLAKRSDRFNKGELDAFWEVLADLIENSIPDVLKPRFLNEEVDYSYKVQKIKILFSFREEFLPEFESITAKIPSLKYSRFRLLPMNGNQAYEVITKTWKGAISKAEANKIVRFFSNDDESVPPYELMTIEPSLLSQVCSLLEKERLVEGKDKISAEFLDQYSKEFLLRSIYNEAMNESNGAVVAAVALPAGARPVNEFAEDKLITDEGYRTRYALAAGDERLRPGLEVLKSRYFVREDGRVVELTHDVLTPLIKHDREERRKELAIAATRKKARRRAALIVLLALLTALGFWGLALLGKKKAEEEKKQAIDARDSAKNEKEGLDKTIAGLQRQINSKRDSMSAANNRKDLNDTTKGNAVDPSAERADLLAQRAKDSSQIRSLRDSLEAQKKAGEVKDSSQRAFTTATRKKFDSTTRDAGNAKWQIASLQRRVALDSSQLALLRKNYEELGKNYTSTFAAYADYMPTATPDEPLDPAADTASLKLDMYQFRSKKKAPNNLRIYLLPDSSYNRKIINTAKTYQIRCEQLNLDKAKGRKVARHANGNYVFLDVRPGNYFIKVCAYYGGYYWYTKTEKGNVTISCDASPPIR